MFLVYFLFFICTSVSSFSLDNFSIEADEVVFEQAKKILKANGHVHISKKTNKGLKTLECDKLIYDVSQKRITVEGNVIIKEPNGQTINAETANISDDFKEGLIKTLSLVTADNTHFASSDVIYNKNIKTCFKDGIYTPCNVCKLPSDKKPPFWQIRAREITHDHKAKIISYKHAILEIKGIPVFYWPYFYHPDRSVKHKSGFLLPSLSYSKDFGAGVQMPYYYTISPYHDLTIMPIGTTKQGSILTGEYRRRFFNGEAQFGGSYTHARSLKDIKVPKKRWHIATKLHYHPTEEYRIFADINRASDTTYLMRYPMIGSARSFMPKVNLTSTVLFEHFRENRYMNAQGLSFQTDKKETTPLILPTATYHSQHQPLPLGGIIDLEGNILSLHRKSPIPGRCPTQMNRLSTGLKWTKPYVNSFGHVFLFSMSHRIDLYHTHRYYHSEESASLNPRRGRERTIARYFPQINADWRYPLLKSFSNNSWIFEPRVGVVASPNQLNNRNIPNEDSRTFELDDTTLFLPNRSNGIDWIDSGYRVVYGVNNTWMFANKQNSTLFLGQSRRLDHKNVIHEFKGENQNVSDYIVKFTFSPNEFITARYRGAFHPKTFNNRFSEIGALFNFKYIILDGAYIHLDKTSNRKNENIDQLLWRISTPKLNNFALSYAQINNLNRHRPTGSLAHFASLVYENECFQMNLGLHRTFYHNRDVKPDTGVFVQFVFKNLGTITPASAPKYPGSLLHSF
ncbi:MAG: LPS-assembly protein LptD [Alphaproteobacteria bacterium]